MRMRVPWGASPVVRGAAVDGEAQSQRKQAGQRKRRALGGSFLLFAVVVPRWSKIRLYSAQRGAGMKHEPAGYIVLHLLIRIFSTRPRANHDTHAS